MPYLIRRVRWITVVVLAMTFAAAQGCVGGDTSSVPGDEDDYGIDGPFEPGGPLGKADNAGVPGPKVNTNTSATQVWDAKNKWQDTNTAAARKAGMAWGADSGLNWDEKYALWVESMERAPGNDTYYETFTLTTPWWGKTVPAPKLECAEMAIFLRVTFAAWYQLPFYLTAVASGGTRVYFGHFGARTKTLRYKNTPKFGQYYSDYSHWSEADLEQNGWPRDEKLRERGLYGGGDEMPFIEEGALAGAYFDEIHLNKRAGHFLRLVLGYFGSMHLASSRNTFNLKPQSLREGDVLLERWQRQGIGHTLIVKEVTELSDGQLEAQLVSGSMPRRQPKWEDGVASKHYFTLAETGGEGANSEGDEYAKLGGGIKRFRVTKNVNGYWTNTWMNADEASWISDTDYDAISARPNQFENLLGEVSPEQKRGALAAMIEDSRNHLRQYPASCSARIKREDAFKDLYELNETEFGVSRAQTDAQFRTLEDYVFAELEYAESKTCCWNSSTSAMYQIALDYNQSLQEDMCAEPVVFKNTNGGYQVFADYAAATDRGHLWKPWSADESCPQAGVANDTLAETDAAPWCELESVPGGGGEGGTCSDDGHEDNDNPSQATALGSGTHTGLQICSADDDYYQFTANGSLTVTINFEHDNGDLDMALFSGSEEVGSSQGTDDSETVTASGTGTYTLRVYGYSGAANSYQLSATTN